MLCATYQAAQTMDCWEYSERRLAVFEQIIVFDALKNIRAWFIVLECPFLDFMAHVTHIAEDVYLSQAYVLSTMNAFAVPQIELHGQAVNQGQYGTRLPNTRLAATLA